MFRFPSYGYHVMRPYYQWVECVISIWKYTNTKYIINLHITWICSNHHNILAQSHTTILTQGTTMWKSFSCLPYDQTWIQWCICRTNWVFETTTDLTQAQNHQWNAIAILFIRRLCNSILPCLQVCLSSEGGRNWNIIQHILMLFLCFYSQQWNCVVFCLPVSLAPNSHFPHLSS